MHRALLFRAQIEHLEGVLGTLHDPALIEEEIKTQQQLKSVLEEEKILMNDPTDGPQYTKARSELDALVSDSRITKAIEQNLDLHGTGLKSHSVRGQ